MQIGRALDAVEVASATNPRRRLVILLRKDGHFCFAEQYHYSTCYDGKVIAEGWQTLSPNGIFETAAIAEAEGRASLPHLTI